MKKKFLAVAMATVMTVAMSVSAFAAETVKGVAWWNAENTKSTPIAIADGETVKFKIDVAEATETETTAEGTADTYAAFCVEATDGALYFTCTSAGDAWGADDPAPVKETGVADAKKGGSYTVTVTRTGNSFTAEYVDNATGNKMFKTLGVTAAEGKAFGETKVYVMGQVGTLTVEQVVDTPAGDGAGDGAGLGDNVQAGDVATVLPVVLLAGAAVAVVVLKKRAIA